MLEAGGAAGGWAHFWRVYAEAEMGEPGLAEGHEAGVQIAPHKKGQERHGGIVFVGNGIEDCQREI